MGSRYFWFLHLCLVPTCIYSMTLESYEFRVFNTSVAKSFSLVPPAEISDNLLKLTPTVAPNSNWISRAMLRVKFKLWNANLPLTDESWAKETSRVASFNTSFLVVASANEKGSGGGIAFLIGPDTLLPQFVGVTNTTFDGDILAVLVQIQTVRPTEYKGQVTVHLNSTQMTVRSFTIPRTPYINIWIDYNIWNLEVRVAASSTPRQEPPRPARANVKFSFYISQIVIQDSYFGFSASMGNATAQTYSISRWTLEVNDFSGECPVEVWSDYVVLLLAGRIVVMTITLYLIFLFAWYWNFDMMSYVIGHNHNE